MQLLKKMCTSMKSLNELNCDAKKANMQLLKKMYIPIGIISILWAFVLIPAVIYVDQEKISLEVIGIFVFFLVGGIYFLYVARKDIEAKKMAMHMGLFCLVIAVIRIPAYLLFRSIHLIESEHVGKLWSIGLLLTSLFLFFYHKKVK